MSTALFHPTWAQLAQQGYGTQATATVPVGTATSLESALPCTTISCSQCHLPIRPAAPGRCIQPLLGQILWLPAIKDLPAGSVVLNTGAEVNEGAGNHPCVVVMASECGCHVFCMPVTSFNGDGIREKYCGAHDPRKFFEEYVPLDQGDTHIPSTHPAGKLEYRGQRMRYPSYVHLEFGYWIPAPYLRTRGYRSLTLQALSTVKQAYATAELHRLLHGSAATVRINRRTPSPPPPPSQPYFGLPTPSPSPPRRTVDPSTSQDWFELPRRGSAALEIRAPPSPAKEEAMRGNWR